MTNVNKYILWPVLAKALLENDWSVKDMNPTHALTHLTHLTHRARRP